MLRSAFGQLLPFIWPLLTSGLVYKCNFDGELLKERTGYSLTSPFESLAFSRALPLSRAVSHSCTVKTGENESFLRVKARAFGGTNGKDMFKLCII